MPLNEAAVRSAKPVDKPIKMADSGGLYLLLNPSGSKWWRLDYRFQGKRKTLSMGVYPDTGLRDARDRRDAAKKQLANNVDPGVARKAVKASGLERNLNSLEVVAREWHGKQATKWSDSHASRIMLRLQNDIFPWLGARPVAEVTAKELLGTINRIVDRGAVESAHRVLQNCGQVFRYAVASGRADRNPAVDLRGALPPVKGGHLAAIVEPSNIGALLRAIDGYKGSFVTKCALRLAPLVFVRPGELRQAEWREIDFSAEQWNIPAEKMKLRESHLVPLARQSLEILKELHPLTGSGQYVFPSVRSAKDCMSDNTVLSALRRLDYAKEEMSGHGFRAMARTVLDEVLQFRPDFIEHQLGRAVRDPNGRAYNRTAHLVERRKMMAAWADYLDTLKADNPASAGNRAI